MNKEEEIAFANMLFTIRGELIATQAAVRGLLLSHPNPQAATATVVTQLEEHLSTMLHSGLPDKMVDGFQRARKTIFPTARNLGEAP